MKCRLIILGILVLSMLAVVEASADQAKLRRSTRPARGQYIVVLEPPGGALEIAIQVLTNMYGGDVRHVFRGAPWQGYAIANMSETAALALSRDPRVRAVEEDGIVQLMQAAPKHPHWGLDRTNQRSLGTDGLDYVISAGCWNASNAYIYVMDTGISDPNGTEFGGRLVHGYASPGLTFEDTDAPAGHGTSVASIAGGSSFGVATGATIVNVKVVGPTAEQETVSNAIAAIRDFINPHAVTGPKIVNISLQYPYSSGLEQEIINSINNFKVTYVVAAGQQAYGQDTCSVGSPGRMGQTNGVISVASSYLAPNAQNQNYMLDARSVHPGGDGLIGQWESNYGACVDIFAPGTRVAARDRYGTQREFSGTSASTPYVAGAAARRASIYFSSYSVIQPPTDVEAAVKADATIGLIDPATIGAGSPNLLLYRFYMKCRSA